MNYLAHIFLARHSHDAMLGALLGDFVKMNGAADYPNHIAQEIILHRKIDTYTDQHPLTQEAKELFSPLRRRYAGIALDIFYDHVLAKHWQHYVDVDLEQFIKDFYRSLPMRQSFFNKHLAYAVPRMVQQDWLGSYVDFDGVAVAIERVSTRLSRNGHLLRGTVLDLEQHYAELSEGFFEFFPLLQSFVIVQREMLNIDPS